MQGRLYSPGAAAKLVFTPSGGGIGDDWRETPMKPLDRNALLTRRQWIGGAAALGAGAAFPALAQGGRQWPNVERLISGYVDSRRVANMVVTLGFGTAEPTVIARGLDTFAQPRRSDADSIYRIYSMTKPITGMAAMMLIHEGKLGLDQPLHEILPKYRTMQVQKVYDGPITPDNLEPAVRPITIRHLLTHTAGLGYGIIQSGPIAEAYRQRGLVPGVVSRLQSVPAFRGTAVPSLELFADRLAEMPLVYQPGTRWSYSMSLDLMGRVIEVVSGQSFDAFLRERFFDPLAMGDTHFQVPREDADRLTTSYFLLGDMLLPIDLGQNSIYLDKPPFPFGGAGLASTPRDYDRFLEMLLGFGTFEGRRVMSERAVRLGTSDLLPDTLVPGGGYNEGWGFGAGGRVGTGENAGVYGWAGAAGTIGFAHAGLGLRAGLYTQYMPFDAYPLLDEFPAAIRADLAAQGGA
jgi:CubicO group peptidase (beta-lactamase class C family)